MALAIDEHQAAPEGQQYDLISPCRAPCFAPAGVSALRRGDMPGVLLGASGDILDVAVPHGGSGLAGHRLCVRAVPWIDDAQDTA
jgi:hypothetical protein